MTSIFFKKPAAVLFAAMCIASTSVMAQIDDAKHALAVKLAQMQQKNDGALMADQLTAMAVQPLLAGWSQRLDETVPPARQKEIREKLDVELKKFAQETQKTVEAQIGKLAEEALVPIFMEKLTEDELKTIITYMESPVSEKFRTLGPEASNAWAQRVVDATKAKVEASAKNFDATASRIVNSATASASGSKAASKAKK